MASDFNADGGTLRLATKKGDGTTKIFHAVLSEEGVDLFSELTAGLSRRDLIFKRADGSAWGDTDQTRPMAEACKNAG